MLMLFPNQVYIAYINISLIHFNNCLNTKSSNQQVLCSRLRRLSFVLLGCGTRVRIKLRQLCLRCRNSVRYYNIENMIFKHYIFVELFDV